MSHLSQESLPSYGDAVKGGLPRGCHISVSETTDRKIHCQPEQQEKPRSRFATLKSILSGSVHQHNPRLAYERSLDHALNAPSKPREPSSSSSSSPSSHTKTSKVIEPGYSFEQLQSGAIRNSMNCNSV